MQQTNISLMKKIPTIQSLLNKRFQSNYINFTM